MTENQSETAPAEVSWPQHKRHWIWTALFWVSIVVPTVLMFIAGPMKSSSPLAMTTEAACGFFVCGSLGIYAAHGRWFLGWPAALAGGLLMSWVQYLNTPNAPFLFCLLLFMGIVLATGIGVLILRLIMGKLSRSKANGSVQFSIKQVLILTTVIAGLIAAFQFAQKQGWISHLNIFPEGILYSVLVVIGWLTLSSIVCVWALLATSLGVIRLGTLTMLLFGTYFAMPLIVPHAVSTFSILTVASQGLMVWMLFTVRMRGYRMCKLA